MQHNTIPSRKSFPKFGKYENPFITLQKDQVASTWLLLILWKIMVIQRRKC